MGAQQRFSTLCATLAVLRRGTRLEVQPWLRQENQSGFWGTPEPGKLRVPESLVRFLH